MPELENIEHQPMLETNEFIDTFNEMQQPTVEITRAVAEMIKPGMNEQEIADIYTQKLAEAGFKDHWYPILVYSGELTSKPISRRYHLPSSDVIIKENDIVMLDATPLKGTVWSNWAETFVVGQDEFYTSLIEDTKKVVDETYEFATTQAKTIGDVYDFCNSRIEFYGLVSLDSRNDVGHSIFQVPEGQTVDQTPEKDRTFINEDFRDTLLSKIPILSLEPQLGRKKPDSDEMFGAKIQKVIIRT